MISRGPLWVIGQMSVSSCRGSMPMPEQSPDDRQSDIRRHPYGCECVTKIMQTDVGEAGMRSKSRPRPLEISTGLVVDGALCVRARDDEGAFAGQATKQLEGGGGQHDRFRTSFGVRQTKDASLDIYFRPSKVKDLPQSRPRKYEQSYGRYRIRIEGGGGFGNMLRGLNWVDPARQACRLG